MNYILLHIGEWSYLTFIWPCMDVCLLCWIILKIYHVHLMTSICTSQIIHSSYLTGLSYKVCITITYSFVNLACNTTSSLTSAYKLHRGGKLHPPSWLWSQSLSHITQYKCQLKRLIDVTFMPNGKTGGNQLFRAWLLGVFLNEQCWHLTLCLHGKTNMGM